MSSFSDFGENRPPALAGNGPGHLAGSVQRGPSGAGEFKGDSGKGAPGPEPVAIAESPMAKVFAQAGTPGLVGDAGLTTSAPKKIAAGNDQNTSATELGRTGGFPAEDKGPRACGAVCQDGGKPMGSHKAAPRTPFDLSHFQGGAYASPARPNAVSAKGDSVSQPIRRK